MFGHGDISTETDKKPFLFTLIAFLGSLTAGVLLLVFSKGEGLGVFAGILMLLLALAAGAVLFAMVSDKAYIEEETLYMSYLFKRRKVSLKAIGKIMYKDNEYLVYDRKGAILGTINGQLTGIDKILHKLDKSGVPFV